jgi:hypothetical protein
MLETSQSLSPRQAVEEAAIDSVVKRLVATARVMSPGPRRSAIIRAAQMIADSGGTTGVAPSPDSTRPVSHSISR